MGLTKRTHSNPCLWTAHWNEDYYKCVINGEKIPSARNQKVYSLNVKADKIIHIAVDNIHYDKWLGVAEITPDAMKDFCKRYFSERYEQFVKDIEHHPETLYLDIENIWTTMEATPSYKTLLEVLKNQEIKSGEDKVNLACFIVIQTIRSHAILGSMLEFSENTGTSRFEYYWQLKHMLSNVDFLMRMVTPLVYSQWIVYVTSEHTFPLPDTPIFSRNRNIMVALSPRMLLEVNLKVPGTETSWIQKNGISSSKLNEYRKRCISNTFKEIIFNDEDVLENWRMQPEFRQRVKLMSDQKSFNALVQREGNREIWKINAFGNLDAASTKK